MCIPHIVHTNNLPGGQLYKRVHPAKEIDLTAVKMMRHIRSSLTFFSNCKLKTVHFVSVFTSGGEKKKSNDMVNSSRCSLPFLLVLSVIPP